MNTPDGRNAMSFQSSFGAEVGQILHSLHKEHRYYLSVSTKFRWLRVKRPYMAVLLI